jgi:predicted AAA+ superfamily ATPase
MRYVSRQLEKQLIHAAANFSAVVLTGPRRSGKTFLLKHLFPEASYFLLEDPDVLARLRADPQGFLDALSGQVVLDEVQNAPEIFALVRSRIDRAPAQRGRWLLTGSQEAPLMQHVTESMAGRAAVLQLLPLSTREHEEVSVLHGGFPEVIERPQAAGLWFASYLQTYLERDVRAVTAVRDLATFRRFLALLASRHGQMVNKTDLAAPLGVSVPTITQWLNVLEITAQILVIPPFYENLGKRLIKTPKIYFADSGVACHLLGIESGEELERSPFLGALFEGFLAAEITKAQVNAGRRHELYYFRDQQGLEVDFVLPMPGGNIRLIEAKSTRSPTPGMADPMRRLAEAFAAKRANRTRVEMVVAHRPSKSPVAPRVLAPGATAIAWQELLRDPLGPLPKSIT